MGKIDIEFRSKSGQRSIGCIKQRVCGEIIHRSEPFALENSPQSLRYIQMRAVRWEKEEEQAALLPYRAKFLHELAPVHTRIVQHHKCIPAGTHRQSVNKVCLRTFPYTSISRANADKKDLKVLSLASLPEACCQASFAFFTLCLSFSMAMRTASSSELSMIGFRPRPGRVSRPLIPSASNRLTQELTDIWLISVWKPTCSELRPADFKSTARQRIRYAWLLPWRKPSSSCRRCWSVSCITLIFAIVAKYLCL